MSSEINQPENEDIHWHAGKVEKIGTGISVVLMGAAYFFSEARVILASASVITTGLDLAIMGIKARIVSEKNGRAADKQAQHEAFEKSNYNQLLMSRKRLDNAFDDPTVVRKTLGDGS